MAGMMDELLGALNGAGEGGVGSLLGSALGGDTDPTKVESATKSGLGAILGALAGNASKDDGAASLLGAVTKKHDGSILDGLGSVIGAPETAADGEKILGHAFGNNTLAVQEKVAKDSGLDMGTVAKLLPMLAPIVMGMLGKKAKGGGLDAAGLSNMLQGESSGLDLGDLAGMLTGGGAGDLLAGLTGATGGSAGAAGGSSGMMGTIMGMLKKFGAKK